MQSHQISMEDCQHLASKYHQLSPTSTLSSGYESGSGCIESEIDDILYSSSLQGSLSRLSTGSGSSCADDSEYFELESDRYLCSREKRSSSLSCCRNGSEDDTDAKLLQVRDSMLRIISDLQSLGYETNMEDLTQAVQSSIKSKATKGSRTSTSRRHSVQHLSIPSITVSSCDDNNNSCYMKSPVDHLFTEINHLKDRSDRELLYDRLITNLANDGSAAYNTEVEGEEEPIYEEIHDIDGDFDFVMHSDTYRKQPKPPALPPRTHKSTSTLDSTPSRLRCNTTPAYFRQTSNPQTKQETMQCMSWQQGCRKATSWYSINHKTAGQCR